MEFDDILKEKYKALYIKTIEEAKGNIPKKSALRILDIVVEEMNDKAVKKNMGEDPDFDKRQVKKITNQLRSTLKKYKNELLKMSLDDIKKE